ncbi:hypothetical protein [Paenibacillus methanolicus]|uniref:TPR repeat protein n=1 Tax=Paenibacillus methanolicus TaxID=582686 RepID=A0A5S5CLJ9_9BACL|nr:hypothetical protein [Paenibacillus methanolicus]TYP79833.1 hypothetical protein BCM02_101954 [Paenibacillus methanolicus]
MKRWAGLGIAALILLAYPGAIDAESTCIGNCVQVLSHLDQNMKANIVLVKGGGGGGSSSGGRSSSASSSSGKSYGGSSSGSSSSTKSSVRSSSGSSSSTKSSGGKISGGKSTNGKGSGGSKSGAAGQSGNTEQSISNRLTAAEKKLQKIGKADGAKNGYADAYAGSTLIIYYQYQDEAYMEEYDESYRAAYAAGQKKLQQDIAKAANEGYALGKKTNQLKIPETYQKSDKVADTFRSYFYKAVSERDQAISKKYYQDGLKHGLKDVHLPPQKARKVFADAYENGYAKGQSDLKTYYMKQGRNAAFQSLKYEEPATANPKLAGWYREGFDEAQGDVQGSKNNAFLLGAIGRTYKYPDDAELSEAVYKRAFLGGQVAARNFMAFLRFVLFVTAACWLVRRFIIAWNYSR